MPISWSRFYLDYDKLNERLVNVKREFGLRKSVSTRSLTGETHSFAEILDLEAEKIVLFYLRVQGDLAKRVWELREQHFQTSFLGNGMARLLAPQSNDSSLSLGQINALCDRYRALGQEVLDLLEYLDYNVLALRRIVRRHDKHFQSKMSSLYFDSRLSSGTGNSTALVQLVSRATRMSRDFSSASRFCRTLFSLSLSPLSSLFTKLTVPPGGVAGHYSDNPSRIF